MLKFDKDVLNTLQKLEKEGFESYAVGNCIIEWGCGETPQDWDLVTKATGEDVVRIFPEAECLSGEQTVYRLDFTHEETDEDGNVEVLGALCDITILEGTIEEELAKAGFTIGALADNPARRFVDPYDGMEDIKKRMLRGVKGKDLDKAFQETPILMMQAMRYVSLYGFDLHKDVYEAILRNWRILLDHPIGPIRDELETIVVGPNTGKALNMMADTGLMAVIFGEEVSRKMTSGEMQQFMTLTENIDKVKPFRMRRLGLLFTLLSEKKGKKAIERMNFDVETEMHLMDAMTELIKIQFLSNSPEFKRYLYEHGLDRYNYVHNLSKAHRIIYDQTTLKIEARNHMMKEIQQKHEPVFPEELCIDANDIMEEGITDDREQAEKLLTYVLAKVHQDVRNNDRKYLLKMAKKYNKSKFSTKSRYVHWLR